MSFILIAMAPSIARRFYPDEADQEILHISAGPGDLYHIACFVLGAFLLLGAAQLTVRLAATAMSSQIWQRGQVADVATIMIYGAGGLLLVFGGRKIGAALASLRYDPAQVPRQQYSIAIVLIVVVFFAAVFGVIRWIARDSM